LLRAQQMLISRSVVLWLLYQIKSVKIQLDVILLHFLEKQTTFKSKIRQHLKFLNNFLFY
jgi:hypothetical protein